MATKTETVDEAAQPAQRVQPVETPTRPRGRGLAIGGIVAAGVLTAGALFGGGVLLGASLPDAHPAPFAEAMHEPGQPPLGDQRFEGPRGPHAGQNGGPQNGGPRGGDRSDAPHPPAPDELDSDAPDAANP
jgi:hypothetical protein